MQTTPEAQLEKLNIQLPPAPKPVGIYKTCIQIGNLIYTSGHGPVNFDGTLIQGRLGDTLNKEEGKLAARQVGLTILASLKNYLGSLNKIKRVVKILGMVSSTPDFELHPFVINGCSELMVELWGEDLGIGVRSAVGMGSLPGNIPVEIEAVFELE